MELLSCLLQRLCSEVWAERGVVVGLGLGEDVWFGRLLGGMALQLYEASTVMVRWALEEGHEAKHGVWVVWQAPAITVQQSQY